MNLRIDATREVLESMPGVPKLEPLHHARMDARIFDGRPTITLRDGRAGQLAIVDEDGRVVETGEHVARAAWALALTTYCQALLHGGHITISTEPPKAQAA